ncbi:MAG: alanine--tRNA ligase [Longimicrobiales bacterium]|nr:alanine--tRNA ligase [Longimicrobiales bacterium]
MKAAEIRQRFLSYFERHGHEVCPSASLVPVDDPTLLFTNAGMVPYKQVFLGEETVPYARAVTTQKCVRAGGKHNDLEEVGRTARHHTFFEMLGNFSFGDYFKDDAVRFAWEFLTDELGIESERLFVTVHESDDEAERLWIESVGVPAERVFRLGDADNFWQMADTGPCGPCSELHYDGRDAEARAISLDRDAFIEQSDTGRIVEIWNLVFMQFDRDEAGELHPLPAPSIDTGAGLERIAAVLQGVESNFHTDLFLPLLERVGEIVGTPYDPDAEAAVGYHVLADHARAVAFLLADGVFPSNAGRGYVLRRILRRAVRHAWLLGLREPALVSVVERVIETMSETWPELDQRREHIVRTTRAEEERFLTTIEGGLERFDEIAPLEGPPAGTEGVIPGEDIFRLYDTFGFPLDLTRLMAEERGWTVDAAGFEAALEAQRRRSRDDRAATHPERGGEVETLEGWSGVPETPQRFTGYDTTQGESHVLAWRCEGDRLGLILEDNPFYLESGGQLSDRGRIEAGGWRMEVEDVRRVAGYSAVFGCVEGEFEDPGEGEVEAVVDRSLRHDTARNHTATHLLHAALREALGDHVVQRGSLVAPDRLRFDFAHSAPLTAEERATVERRVNEAIWVDHPVVTRTMAYDEAVGRGAMALFGEKYEEEVRVVEIPGVSMELCGGTHVRHTGEIGLFRLVSESGVAAGVRRVEAQTGRGAFGWFAQQQATLDQAAAVLKAPADRVPERAARLVAEVDRLERMIDEIRQSGGSGEESLVDESIDVAGTPIALRSVRLRVRGADDARAWGDGFLADGGGVAVAAAEDTEGKIAFFAFASDAAIGAGVRADALIREVAAIAGGRGGGRPHLAQAGVGDPGRVKAALESLPSAVRRLTGGGS